LSIKQKALVNLFKVSIILLLFSTDWASYQSEDLSFQVKFPQNFNVVKDSLETKLGKLEIHNVYHYCGEESNCRHSDSKAIYSLIYMNYPENTFSRDSSEMINELFDETLDQRLIEMNASLDYQSPIEHDLYDARILRFSNPEGKVCKAKFILYKDCFVALQVISTLAKSKDDEVKGFLNSFHIIEP